MASGAATLGMATLGMATFGMATCPSTPRSSPASANSAGSTVTMAIAHSSSPVPATIPSSRKPPKSVASARKNTLAEPIAPVIVPGPTETSAARTASAPANRRRISP